MCARIMFRLNQRKHHSRTIIPLTVLFSTLLCISIGFSTWNITGGDHYDSVEGEVGSDIIETNIIGVDCMTVTSFTMSRFTRYGFNVSNSKPIALTGATAVIQYTLDIPTIH